MPYPRFFERLADDDRVIEMDCDVLTGHWTRRPELDTSAAAVAARLGGAGIASALVVDGGAVTYDEDGGNTRARQVAGDHGWVASHAVNLRDVYGVEEKLDEWMGQGVRAIRLASVTQQVPVTAPGYQLVVREAALRGLVLLVEGGFNEVQHALRGCGTKAVFLDISYYETADFMIATRDEPGFVASTRRLLGPDTLEIISETVGPQHLAFGSGSPLQDLEPTVWRLRDARVDADSFRAIAGGTIKNLLGE